MDKSKVATVLLVLAAVVGLGLGIGWLATRSTDAPPPQTSGVAAAPEPAPQPRATPTRTRPISRPQTVVQSGPDHTGIETPSLQSTNLIADWEDRLDEILGSEDEDTNKVVQLMALFPRLPAEGQDEVAQHLSNLVEDEHYEPLLKFALDPALPEEVLDTFLADLLNRPNATKLPAFLEIAFTPSHPKAEEARELLELYLDEEDELSKDKAAVGRKVEEWLKENPD